jgi:hypothetical protein
MPIDNTGNLAALDRWKNDLAMSVRRTLFRKSWRAPSRMPLRRLCAVAILLLVVSAIIAQPRAYNQAYRSVWYDPIAAIIPLWVERIAVLLALGLAVSMCVFGTERILGHAWTSRLNGLVFYLLCSGITYAITYNLATGYVSSGDVRRTAPRSQTKTGQETFGKSLTLGDGQGTPASVRTSCRP